MSCPSGELRSGRAVEAENFVLLDLPTDYTLSGAVVKKIKGTFGES
jgi:hypothetical protein